MPTWTIFYTIFYVWNTISVFAAPCSSNCNTKTPPTPQTTPTAPADNFENHIPQYHRCGKVKRWPSNYEVKVLGLFTFTDVQNQTNYLAIYRERLMQNNLPVLPKRYSMTSINVCDDAKIVLEALLFTILDNERPSIDVVISDVSFELTKLISALLLPTGIRLFAYTSEAPYPASAVDNLNYAYSFYFDRLAEIRQSEKLLERNAVKEISVHVLCKSTSNNCQRVEALLDPIISSKRICVRKMVYEYSDKNLQIKVDNAVEMMNDRFMIFVGGFYEKIRPKISHSVSGFLMHSHLDFNTSRHCLLTLSKSLHIDPGMFNYTQCAKVVTDYRFTDEYTFGTFFLAIMYEMITNQPAPYKKYWYLTDEELQRNIYSRVAKGKCLMPECKPGMESNFDYYSTNDTYWIQDYGWYCRKCQKGFFKSKSGYHQCQPCAEGLKNNQLNTGCFDPIPDEYLNFSDMESITLLLFSGFCFMMVGITLVIFIWFRDTPVVVSSDRTMTFLQYTSCMLLDITVPALFIGSPTSWLCILQPTVIGILSILITSITLSRTQKLLFIFETNTKATAKEVRLTKGVQWFLILFFITISIGILIVSFQMKSSTVLKSLSVEKKTRFVQCNTGQHVQLQLAYLFLLLLFNMVQGLRARRLPSNYRETIYIVCSTFVSSIAIGAMTVIFISQQDHRWKQIILAFTVLLVNIVGFSIQNFFKVYIILFRKDLNDPHVFRKAVMQRIKKNLTMQHTGK